MKEPRWITYEEYVDEDIDPLTCPCCGGQVKILTDALEGHISEGLYWNGDKVECLNHCGYCRFVNGHISVNSFGEAYIRGDW